MRAIFAASSPMRSRSVTILMIASTIRKSPAAGWRRAIRWLQSVSMLTSSAFTRWSSATTASSARISPDMRPLMAARICDSTRPPISRTRERNPSRSRSYCFRECSVCAILVLLSASTKPAGYIVFCFLALGLDEDIVGCAVLDQLAEIHIGSIVGHARRLLHVVRNDHYGVVL